MLKQDPKLRLVYKEFPILGPVSVTAAHAALAAKAQGKYDAFHAAMMAARGNITDDTVYQVAGSVGLDVAKLKRDMASPEIAQTIKANMKLADALDIHGTPAFIIGDKVVPGAVDLDALKTMVADARKNSRSGFAVRLIVGMGGLKGRAASCSSRRSGRSSDRATCRACSARH